MRQWFKFGTIIMGVTLSLGAPIFAYANTVLEQGTPPPNRALKRKSLANGSIYPSRLAEKCRFTIAPMA